MMTLLDVFPYFGNYDTGYLIGIVLGVFGVLLIPAIFYMLTLQSTLRAIRPENRAMPPGNVWLLFIPLFNLIWMFIVVSRLADSIQNELNARGIMTSDRPTYNIGLAWCILCLVGRIPLVGGLFSLACMVCWIIHWVKVNEYKKQFQAEPYNPNQESQIFGHV